MGKFGNVSLPGLRNVTSVPTGTRRWVGDMPFVAMLSRLAAVSVVRAAACQQDRVVHGLALDTALPLTGRRIASGFVSGPSWLPDSVV